MRLALHVLADCVAVTLIVLFAFGLFSGELFPAGEGKLIAEIWIYTIPIALAGHLVLPRLQSRMTSRHKLVQSVLLIAVLLIIAVAGSLAGTLIVFALNLEPETNFAAFLFVATKLTVYLAVLVGIIHAMVIALGDELAGAKNRMLAKEIEAERARKLAAEARLASLESHVHPHFLFNALNTISALIRTSPERAERLIERMSGLLRFSLNSREGGLVRLDRELRVVQDYLEIEKERFGNRLRFRIESAPELSGVSIPPLSIQTLVENSIKHAVAPSREGAEIRVCVSSSDSRAKIEVIDSGPGFEIAALSGGHGLENLGRRLTALYGGSEPLRVDRQAGQTAVSFEVPA